MKKSEFKEALPYYVLVLPGLLYLLINNYMPMFGILIAFKRIDFSKGILGSPWCGLDNFRFLFLTKDAWTILRNTVLYNVAFFLVGTFSAVTLAILLNEIRSKIASKLYQTVILLPYLMSWVVVSYLCFAFLSADTGFINNSVLPALGKDKISWYTDKTWWPIILTVVANWKSVGYSMIIYLSGIVGISQDYFEAARIDGATKWEQIKYITLPLLKPTVITLFILSVGQIFRSDFGLFYQVTKNSGAIYDYTRTIDVYVYQALMKNSDYSMSSAASVLQSVAGFVLIMLANQVVRKVDENSSLF